MTQRKRTSAKQSAPLYARLIVEEYERREAGGRAGHAAHRERFTYWDFLRSQADTHNRDCYEIALRTIAGKP